MILDEIAAYLAANNLGTVGTSIFMNRSSDEIGVPQITVYELPGRLNDITQTDPIGIEGARIHVMAKAPHYVDARLLAEKAYRLLANTFNMTPAVGGAFYLAIVPLSPPYPIGRDTNDYPMVAFNCEVDKRPSPLI